MANQLKIEFPSQGWKQILTARKEILDAYDRAREQAKAHEVETYHGRVAEAACRKWLAGFLPKRYGVTPGYIVSPGIPSNVKVPHFDVIIYDQIESPVLWIEDNPDVSEQGRSLAIPVEYVRGVLEVKSHVSAATAKAAIDHLRDLSPVMNGLDKQDEQYKLYLPPTFFCATIFCELREAAARSDATLKAMIGGTELRRFAGGVVLRAEGLSVPHSARIMLTKSETPIQSTLDKTPLTEFGLSDSMHVAHDVHIGATIRWSETEFSRFAFDIVALMNGTYHPGRVSSFYGFGNSFAEMMREAGATVVQASNIGD